eukprot:5181313-Amphidinium_carterae.1
MTIVPTLRSAVARPKPPESAGAQMDSSGSSVVTSIVDALSACIQHVKQTQEQAKTLAGGNVSYVHRNGRHLLQH